VWIFVLGYSAFNPFHAIRLQPISWNLLDLILEQSVQQYIPFQTVKKSNSHPMHYRILPKKNIGKKRIQRIFDNKYQTAQQVAWMVKEQ
jgi:hypothetical protein